MTDSVYRKSTLPAKLDLSNRNTRDQINQRQDDKRGELEGAGSAVAKQSDKACVDVMHQDLRDWLKKHEINGPPPSAEAEARAMWAWMRDFHKEYNDDWFARNMPRLHERFKPVFLHEMRRMKAEVAASNAALAPAHSAAAGGNSGPDLLDFGGPAAAKPPESAAPAPSKGGDLDLLQLDVGSASCDFAAPAAAPAASAAPAVPAALAAPVVSLDPFAQVNAAPLAAAPVASLDPFAQIVDAAPLPAAPGPPTNSGLDGLLDFRAPTSTPAFLDPFAQASASTPARSPLDALDPFAREDASVATKPKPDLSLDPFAQIDAGAATKPKQDANMLDLVF